MIDKKELSIRLNIALDANNYPPKSMGRVALFADNMGITPRASSSWINGEVVPSRKHRNTLCEKENINLAWYEHGHGKMRDSAESNSKCLPILTFEQTIDYKNHIQNAIKEEFSLNIDVSKETFVLKLNNDSLYPIIGNGATIFIDPLCTKYKDDSILLVYDKSSSNVMLRIYTSAVHNKVFLSSPNSKFQPLILNENIRIIGRVIFAFTPY